MSAVSRSSSSVGIAEPVARGVTTLEFASGRIGASPAAAGVATSFIIMDRYVGTGSRKETLRLVQSLGKPVDFLDGVVHAEGSAAGGGGAVASEERLGAVGPGADCDALAIDDR